MNIHPSTSFLQRALMNAHEAEEKQRQRDALRWKRENDGGEAFRRGKLLDQSPYAKNSEDWEDWVVGWSKAREWQRIGSAGPMCLSTMETPRSYYIDRARDVA